MQLSSGGRLAWLLSTVDLLTTLPSAGLVTFVHVWKACATIIKRVKKLGPQTADVTRWANDWTFSKTGVTTDCIMDFHNLGPQTRLPTKTLRHT